MDSPARADQAGRERREFLFFQYMEGAALGRGSGPGGAKTARFGSMRAGLRQLRAGTAAAALAGALAWPPPAARAAGGRASPDVAVTAGETPPEPGRASSASAEMSALGPVTWAGARAEIPLSPSAALVPATELLYLSPVAGDARRELHPYVGAGVAFEAPDGWDWEVSVMHGPRAYGVTSLEGTIEVSTTLGGNPASGRPPADVDLAVTATQLGWRPRSPLGTDVTQLHVDADARLHVTDSITVRPRAMFFVYDRAFATRTLAQVDALTELARVGTFAPRALAGARLTWRAASWLAPLVEADRLSYVADVGTGTELEAGARLILGQAVRATLAGGFLYNSLGGTARRLGDQGFVPLVEAELEVRY
jgi:hypothetical protein